ncbi:hypothetical protein BT96DRAFT_460983 [Gymnopus androsaceus JB14]|uniref:F-box domain-containing protein n=1 Tax=Gymnopus androsaceus JB14 TaxID=1447944 RepID=A0A6A4ILB4_9AGAR|nr:hypothetical protein BT96DRAFT_460983 [Gymnopus androsaceus JB14]
MPALWSSFEYQYSDNFSSVSSVSLLNMFLQRSRLHPIDFTINDLSSSESLADSLSSLTTNENTNRWRHVALADQESSAVNKILRTLIYGSRSLPELVSLSLDSSFDATLSFPLNCPNLRSLTLNWAPLDLEYARLTVTYLDLTYMSPKETLRLILCCPNIQVLVVRQPIEKWDLVAAPTNITNIRCNTAKFTMQFGDIDSGALPKIYDQVIFPELIHLELLELKWRDIEFQNYHVASLCSMLERSRSPLTHLTIHSVPFTSAELLQLLLCVSSVTTLDLEEPDTATYYHQTVYLVLKYLAAPHHCDQHDARMEHNGHDHLTNEGDDDEEELELSDSEEDDIAVPEGHCLLPRLKDLTVVIRPRNALLLKLIRSRWRPSLLEHSQQSQTSDNSRNSSAEPCTCLQKLRIHAAVENASI